MNLKAGVARTVITPPLTLPHAGWGAQTHIYAEGVEADLWSTVLVLSDGNIEAVIVDLDLGSLTPDQCEEIRKRVSRAVRVESSNVRVSYTHTHAGPYLWADYYEEKKQNRLTYLEYLYEQVVTCSILAFNRRVPVTVGASSGECGLNWNRRQVLSDGRVVCGTEAAGFKDTWIGVVRFEGADGGTVASLVHYSMHPTILGAPNKLISPDYPGTLKRSVEANIGGMCLFLQGAAGDIGPGIAGNTDDIALMRKIGKTLGCAAAALLMQVSTYDTEPSFDRIVESGTTLAYWSEKRTAPKDRTLMVTSQSVCFDVKPTPPPEELRSIAEQLKRKLAELEGTEDYEDVVTEIKYKLKRQLMAADHAELFHGVDSKDIEAHFIRIGDIVLIGVPLEPFSKIGVQIRERSPFTHTFFGGYTNGWEGYFPTTDAYPKGGYEVDTTPFAPGSEEKFIEDVLSILHEIHSR